MPEDCSSHYQAWRREFPEAAEKFRPGGFGENFVTAHMNERNVCIGDVVAVGDEVVLQVSLPRQPCFKLNHRFQLKNFAPNTWKTSRTGWYYRVLKEGSVRVGDEIRLVERPNPAWTIERVQEYLHRNQGDLAKNEELAAIEELGQESRGAFVKRVAKAKSKEKKAQSGGGDAKWKDYKIVEKTRQTPRIVSFVLEAVEHQANPERLMPGAHAKIKLGNGLTRCYSIVGGDINKLELGIALGENSRGGSKYLHETAQVGHILQVGSVTAAVPIASAASNHIFVTGGVGITAFLALVEGYKQINYGCVMHYAVRSSDEIPFRERLDRLGDKVLLYDKQKGQRLDIAAIIAGMPWNSHLYFCGPKRLMEEASREVKAKGISESEVHFESFEADISGDPFEVVVANRGHAALKVGGEETLLAVLQEHFDGIQSSCEVGNCGTCKVTVKEGCVEHRGTALVQEEKATSMLSCVSRGLGRIVIDI